MSRHNPVQTIDGSPLCSLCGVRPVPLCGCGDPMGALCLVCNERENRKARSPCSRHGQNL